MGASFPIHLRADTSRDKTALPPVTHPVSPPDAPTRQRAVTTDYFK
jgi:hypothetical protein